MDSALSHGDRSRLMVSAYACEPWKGSEIGVGWHWVLELSREFDLWVITRANNQEPIERWMAENPGYENIHWVYFDLPAKDLARKHGRKGVHRYYLKWTRKSDALIRATMQSNSITAFLHVTYGNALWPVSHFGASQKFIWGPIGGLETIPREYSRHYSLKSRVMESVRRLVTHAVVLSSGFRRRCRNADLILCKTDITRAAIPAVYKSKAIVMTDVAADISCEDSAVTPVFDSASGNSLKLLCVGRLDAWRGFDLAIEAVARLRDTGQHVSIDILGKGPDKERLTSMITSLGLIDRVYLRGEVTADDYRSYLAETDVVLNPSLKEGAVTVSFDAMAAGKPLIALDTTGYTRYFHPDYSVVIPQGSRAQVISSIAEAINGLYDASLRQSMFQAARKAACEVSWKFHGDEIRSAVRSVISGKNNV